MRFSPHVLAATIFTLGCNSGTSATPAASGADTCDLLTRGPLVGYSYQTMPRQTAAGGAVSDGIYDLVQIVDHTKASGEWSSNNAPAFRWALRFAAEERAADHTEGSMMTAIDLPPARGCELGRFATVGTQFRTQTTRHPELNAEAYTATPDGALLILKDGVTFVFRRRS